MKFDGEATKQKVSPNLSTFMLLHQTWWTDSRPRSKGVQKKKLPHFTKGVGEGVGGYNNTTIRGKKQQPCFVITLDSRRRPDGIQQHLPHLTTLWC